MKDWKKELKERFCSVWEGGGSGDKDYYCFHGFGEDAPSEDGNLEVDSVIAFIESLLSEQEEEWKQSIRAKVAEETIFRIRVMQSRFPLIPFGIQKGKVWFYLTTVYRIIADEVKELYKVVEEEKSPKYTAPKTKLVAEKK